jgi:hypothetical protein
LWYSGDVLPDRPAASQIDATQELILLRAVGVFALSGSGVVLMS